MLIQQPLRIKAHGDMSGTGWQVNPMEGSDAISQRKLGTKHIAALGDADAAVRSRAADDLGMFGESAAEAIPLLIQALCDTYEPVRLNAAYTLGSIGAPGCSAAH